MVKVKLFANFREAAGNREVIIYANNVRELLNNLVREYPLIKELISREEYLHITKNGYLVRPEEYDHTQFESSDEVAIFPPVSGG